MKYDVNISFVLNKLIERLGYTRDELVTILDVDMKTIDNYLTNKNKPFKNTFDLIVQLIEDNDIDIYSLFPFDGDYLFHGSRSGLTGKISTKLNEGDFNDFANGFYLSGTFKNAVTYVINEDNPVIYRFNKSDIVNHKTFIFDKNKDKDKIDWLIYIGLNRNKIIEANDQALFQMIFDKKLANYKVLVGEIADSYNFDVLDDFFNEDCDIDQATKALTLANIGKQYVIKDESLANSLKYIDEYHIDKDLRDYLRNLKKVVKNKFLNSYDNFKKQIKDSNKIFSLIKEEYKKHHEQ